MLPCEKNERLKRDVDNGNEYVTIMRSIKYELREYIENDKSLFAEWFNKLDPVVAVRVDKYIRRMEQGNMGDSKSVGAGVRELRIDYGPGYRVYYGRDGERLIILLAGGSKRSQSRDILAAKRCWNNYKQHR